MYASSRPSVNAASASHRSSGVDPRHQTLRGRLLVTRRSVDLAREKETRHAVRLQAGPQLGRLDEVVFNRVAGPQHHRLFQPRQRMHEIVLDLRRKTHREAVDVDLVDVQTLRLEKNLVPLAVRKPHHLVFERRAIARADTGDLAVEQRRVVDVGANQLVNPVVRVEQMAVDLWPIDRVGFERKRHRRIIAALGVEATEINRSAIQAGRRPGLEPAPLETEGSSRTRPDRARAARRRGRTAAAPGRCGPGHSGTFRW